ncbi:Mu transposase C-terminal domain-containing protein [Paraglaciecola polaris]|uniref:Transposon Tn7 transposition protein tnsB n=1 Tax=Paraglaciecola polaris LMG 21857 TaxID=1129793 RepID=K6ZSC8_9ALTE|nr:Mu transposase C-terminal domain-containing protein [Paraglaciecola polaris]GAC31738.1 transposon Tn7 transposition protein tnsB [Paraglaciecola polaris LMG 21857]
MLLVNSVVEYQQRSLRVLAITPDYAIWIDIHALLADPEDFNFNEITNALRSNQAQQIEDPYLLDISRKANKKELACRDNRWESMKCVANNPLRLFKNEWSNLFRQVIKKSKYKPSRKHFYKLMRQYLQRGQCKNALLPDFQRMGAPNQTRIITTNKVGPKRITSVGIGVPITDDLKQIFRQAIDTFYMKANRMPWVKVHDKVTKAVREQYPNISKYDMPTLLQLKHLFTKEYKPEETSKARNADITFEKDKRQLTSTATAQVLGPGDRFEFDATIIDLYLVSENDAQAIIGRPTLLIAIDVFSRLVSGYYLTFEPPSYVVAMMALANCLENKVDICASLGLTIKHDSWPAIGLPSAVLADKGELLSNQSNTLVDSANVRIENATARRGDAKGIVERKFLTLQAEFKPYAPGVVTDETAKKRGGKDYRLDAELNIRQFEEIIVLLIYKHNLKVMKNYDADPDIPIDLPFTPKDLWNWGIENRSGTLKSFDLQKFKILTLPRTKATVSNLGIKVNSLIYTCPEAFEKGWFLRDKHRTRPNSVQIAFDPRTTNTIYIFPSSSSNKFWNANLTDRSRAYADMTVYEARKAILIRKRQGDKTDKDNAAERQKIDDEIDKRLTSAQQRSKKTSSNKSDNARLKEIRKNKLEAIAKERCKRSVGETSEKQNTPTPNNVKAFKKQDDFSLPDLDVDFDED